MPIDKSRYPPDWDSRSERIQKRDHYTCQHCGAKKGELGQHTDDGQWLKEATIHALVGRGKLKQEMLQMKKAVLTVAHLDHDETNWEVKDERLLTLCATCHLRYDMNDNQRRRAYGKHYRDNQLLLFNYKQIKP